MKKFRIDLLLTIIISQLVLLSCSSGSDSVTANTAIVAPAVAVTSCSKLASVPSVSNFTESFNQPNWGERHDWGYDADKAMYPALDSDNDGIGDTNNQPDNVAGIVHVSVNTPAVAITDGLTEGVAQRSGTMVKFTLRPGDEASGGNRSEIQLFSNQDPICSEAWYAWSVLVPTDYAESVSNAGFHTVGQWHAQRDTSSSDLALQFDFQNPINFEYVPADHVNNEDGSSDQLLLNSKILDESTNTLEGVAFASHGLTKGQWIDFVIHIKWSLESDGFAEAWTRDIVDPSLPVAQQPAYSQIVLTDDNSLRYNGPTAGNSLGNFLKLGLYRKVNVNDDVTGIVFYDEFRRGSSFESVAIAPKNIVQ
ncbi:MAG: heparin lyase I family protein [Methylococcales bacterium]